MIEFRKMNAKQIVQDAVLIGIVAVAIMVAWSHFYIKPHDKFLMQNFGADKPHQTIVQYR